MTRMFQAGPGITHLILGEFNNGSSVVWDSTITRLGPYAAKFTGAGFVQKADLSIPDGCTQRAYIRLGGAPTTAAIIMGIQNTASGDLCTLTMQSDRRLTLNLNTSTAVATSSFVVPIGSFDCCELWCQHTSQKLLSARYNGIEWARVVPSSFAAGSLPIGRPFWGPAYGGLGCDIAFTDMAINSLAGELNNGWCGLSGGGVQTFRPAEEADIFAWTSVGAPTYPECLDDVTPDEFTTYIHQAGGTAGAAAGVYFPVWPVAVPASCVMLGIVGTAAGPTALGVTYRDQNDHAADGGTTLTSGGWQGRYPIVTVERAWDGTPRMLNNGYLMSPALPTRSRVIIVRQDALAAWQAVTTLWMSVDFPYAMPPGLAPTVTAPQPTILATIDPA